MSKVRTLSRKFMKTHPRSGQDTYFVEKVLTSLGIDYLSRDYLLLLEGLNPLLTTTQLDAFWLSLESGNPPPKHHTIRGGNHFKAGDKISLRVWSDAPYNSKQIIIAPDVAIKQVWAFEMTPAMWLDECVYKINGKRLTNESFATLTTNDGLSKFDFAVWFCGDMAASSTRKPFTGQIICWSDEVNY